MLRRLFGRPAATGERVRASGAAPASSFDKPAYAEITEAQLKYLESLRLPVDGKSVIDLGCGVGRLSEHFVRRHCDVLCVDGREDNIKKLREFYPGRKAAVADVESERLSALGKFDIVFCFGLLYHLADELGFIKRAYAMCNEMMIVETCLTDAADPLVRLVKENASDVTQALSSIGSRPSPSYVTTCLRASGFPYVYVPTSLPKHPQYEYKLSNDLSYTKKGRLIRGIFIASKQAVIHDQLKLVGPL